MDDDMPKLESYEEAFEYFEDQFLVSEGDMVEFDVEGADLGEKLYKIQLFTALEDGADTSVYGTVVEQFTLKRMHNEIIEKIEGVRESDNWQNQVRLIVSDDVFQFYALSHAFTESLLTKLWDSELVVPERQSKSSSTKFDKLKYEQKLHILYYSGVLDNGLKSELTNLHRTRNDLTHELEKRHFLKNIDNIESRLDRIMNAINDLHEKVEGYEAYGSE